MEVYDSLPSPTARNPDQQNDVEKTTTSTSVPISSSFLPFRTYSGIDRQDRRSASRRLHEEPELQGYPLFAHFLSQRGYGIFRQFSHLSMRYILYLQAVILDMEEELDKLERKIIREREGEERFTLFNFSQLDACREAEGSDGCKLHHLWLALGEKLDEYQKALLQQHQLAQLPTPSHTDVKDVWNFLRNNDLHRDHGQNPGMFMAYPENSVWQPWDFEASDNELQTSPSFGKRKHHIEEDLVAINASRDQPIKFAQDMRDRLSVLYGRLFMKNRPHNVFGGYTIQGQIFEGLVDTLVLVLSCVIPVVSIVALHFIPTQGWRLGFIVLWTAFFSLSLSYFTGATHVQIFGASLGMAAVQVVFISPGSSYGT